MPLDKETLVAINEITIHRTIPRNFLLFEHGKVCHEFHFIEKGLARVYYLKDGKEITAWFASKGQIVSAIDSLFSGKPSSYNIEIIEDAVIWSLQFNRIEPIFQKFPLVERLGRLLITENYLLLDERVKLFAFCSAEERYERLNIQIPEVVKRVKLGFIASYLGISFEHLSRIRANFRKQG